MHRLFLLSLARGVRSLARGLDVLSPPLCVECGHAAAEETNKGFSAFCFSCRRALPRWRRMDGCARCGSRPGGGLDKDPELAFFGESPSGFETRGRACPGCLSEGSPLHACHALLRYEGSIRRWLPAYKQPIRLTSAFGPSPPVARAIDTLADELAEAIRFEVAPELDLLVSVPVHPTRRRQRGFNHVDPITSRLSTRLRIDWGIGGLARDRRTMTQASLSGEPRVKNVQGAFSCVRDFDRDVRIGLVDDVLTTGSTLQAAAEALLAAGALEVRSLTLAATLPARARYSDGRQPSGPRSVAFARTGEDSTGTRLRYASVADRSERLA